MHRVGITGSASNSVRPRKEKRFTYVLNDADDTKHCAGVNCLAVLKPTKLDNSSYLFTGSRDGTLKRWALTEEDSTCSATFESHVDWVNDAVLVGGNTLVSCSSDTTVKAWDCFSNGSCTRTFRQHTDYVTCLAAAERNNNILASSGLGGEVFIWDLEAALAPLTKSSELADDDRSSSTNGSGNSLPVTSLRTIGSNNSFSLQTNLPQGYVPVAAKGHKESVYALAMNETGTLLVSGGTEKSHRFALQEFGYEGCINLSEVEGFIKLVPIAKLHETDLGHMKWLKEYQNHEMCLVGDDELTVGRCWRAQMLYEFNIMSTSLPDIKDPNVTPEFISESPFLSFEVPLSPRGRRLKGLYVTFKYAISGEDWAWFAKISTIHGVDLMYNPKVFSKPGFAEVGMWLSYWPIGNKLAVGDKVNVSIAVMSGLEVHECGASLVYVDDEITEETLENNLGWVEGLGGDLSEFQLSTGAYYLCRRDFFELMEASSPLKGKYPEDELEQLGWKLLVSKLPKNVPKGQVSALFSRYGTLEDLQILRVPNLLNEGCAFVKCETKEQVVVAIEGLNGKHQMMASGPLQIKFADGELERLEHQLFIGMLPKNVSEGEVSALFSQYGTLKHLYILRGSRRTSKGCAFVTYETKEQAVASIEGLNGKHKMEGSTVPLVVKRADTEEERQARKVLKAQSTASAFGNFDRALDPSLFGAFGRGYVSPSSGFAYQLKPKKKIK